MATQCVILFVDLAGSVSLYARVGDETARRHVQSLQHRLSEQISRFRGIVEEVIGDELMARFEQPDAALSCSISLHRCAELYSQEQKLTLQLRMGMHHGSVIIDQNEKRLFGDTLNLASRVTDIAQANQTIMTDALVQQASASWQARVRRFDAVRVKGKSEAIVVHDLPWQYEDLTAIVAVAEAVPSDRIMHGLTICYQGQHAVLTDHAGPFYIGRAMTNNLVVTADAVSRRHVSIERVHDYFLLTDQSTNGTHLYLDNGECLFLRRQQAPMTGSGQLSLGAPIRQDDDHVIHFNCGPG